MLLAQMWPEPPQNEVPLWLLLTEKNAKASEAAAGKSASAASSSASSASNDAKAAGASASKALASEKAASSSEKVAKASEEAAERVLASIPDEYTEMQTKLQDSFVVIRSLQFELDALRKQHEADTFYCRRWSTAA